MTRTSYSGTTCHYDEAGMLHAEAGPAATDTLGSFVYAIHGQIHRDDGPAVRLVWPDGTVEEQYWLMGSEMTTP